LALFTGVTIGIFWLIAYDTQPNAMGVGVVFFVACIAVWGPLQESPTSGTRCFGGGMRLRTTSKRVCDSFKATM
jgi:hypothetical protein